MQTGKSVLSGFFVGNTKTGRKAAGFCFLGSVLTSETESNMSVLSSVEIAKKRKASQQYCFVNVINIEIF